MSPRSLPYCLAAAVFACTTPDDGAETGSGTSADSNPSASDTSGPGTGGSTAATTGSVDATTGSVDATTGDAPTTGTSATATTGTAESGDSSSGPGTAETGPAAVSFTDVFEQIILPHGCATGYCHGNGAGGLTMTDEATTYANLVEVAATTAVCDQSMRVVPGAPESSILWYRVRPAALDRGMACAPKMPAGSMGLDDSEAQLVDDWIAGGALE